MTLDEIRAAFPHTAHTLYVNHAATGVFSTPVVAALAAYAQARHGDDIESFISFQPTLHQTLDRLATLIGTTSERVAFASSTSDALSVLAEGFPWRAGDRVAVPGCEFPANVYPFMHLRDRGVEVDFIPHHDGVFTPDDVAATLTPRTRLVSVSFVQFLSGYRADLRALAEVVHARDAFLCVDAIQGVGALQVDVEAEGVDFLACGVQKWLMAPRGLAFLYLTKELQHLLRPRAGWLHGPVDWDNFFDYTLAFHPDARRFDMATVNQLGIAGLHAALGLYLDAGPRWCAQRVLDHSARLREGVQAQNLTLYGSAAPAHASGIVTFHHPHPDALLAHLTARAVQASVRNKLVRLSPSWYNTTEEVDRVLDEIARFAAAA